MMYLKKKIDTWQVEDGILDATWQKDYNVFHINIYIYNRFILVANV